MTDDPQRPDPADPGEATQRHELPVADASATAPSQPDSPAPLPAPLQPSAWAAPATPASSGHRPPRGPTPRRPSRAPSGSGRTTRPHPARPERWYEPAARGHRRQPGHDRSGGRARTGPGRGTPLGRPRVRRHGLRPRRAAPSTRHPGSGHHAGHRTSARSSPSRSTSPRPSIDAAAKVGPAVVRIIVTGMRTHGDLGVIPDDGRRIRDHLRQQRLDPDQQARRRRRRQVLTVELKDGRTSPAPSTASTP